MKWVIYLAAIFGASSIAMGAIASHAPAFEGENIEIALQYHQLHSVVLLALGLHLKDKQFTWKTAIPPCSSCVE